VNNREKDRLFNYIVVFKFPGKPEQCVPVPCKTQSDIIQHFVNVRRQPLSGAEYFSFFKYEKTVLKERL